MDFTELVHSQFRKCLVYGAPKTGKTKLVGSLAEKFKLKWVDLENGSRTLKQLPEEWQHRIDAIQIPDSRSFPIAGETCLKIFNMDSIKICYIHGKVNCPLCAKNLVTSYWTYTNEDRRDPNTILVIDSGTQLAMSFMAKIMKDIWDKDMEAMPEWKHYAHQGNLMTNVCSQIQAGKFHCVMISHETEALTPDGKSKLVPVGGTRNFSATFAKFFDEVIYCELRAKEHKFGSSTTFSLNVIAGSRSDIDIAKLEKPSLLPFFDIPVPTKSAAPTPTLVTPIRK